MSGPVRAGRRLAHLLAGERSTLATVLVYALFIGLTTLAIPVAVQALVGTVAFGALMQPIFVLAVLLVAVLVMFAVSQALSTWVVERLQQRLFVRVAMRLAMRLVTSTSGSSEPTRRAELMNRFLDIATVHKTISYLLLNTLTLVLQTSIGLLALAFYHPLLAVFGFVFAALLALIIFALGTGALETSVAESSAKYRLLAWLEEVAEHPSLFRGAAAELAVSRAEGAVRGWLRSRRAHFRIVFRQSIGLLGLQVFASAGLLALGGALVVQRQLTLGQLIAAELIVTAVAAGIGKLGKSLEAYYDLVTSAEKLAQVEEALEPESDGSAEAEAPPAGATLSLDRLSLRDREQPLLSALSFDVPAGGRVALLGATGAGKSALLHLLHGDWDGAPASGSVMLNGLDLRAWRKSALRERVAVVRAGGCFAGTVEENVLIGRRGLGAGEAQLALERVGLWAALAARPEGLGLMLGPDCSPLSRGQSLLLVLARAMVRPPELLLVDNLSLLDDDTRARVLALVLDRSLPMTVVIATTDEVVAARCDATVRLPRVAQPAASAEVSP